MNWFRDNERLHLTAARTFRSAASVPFEYLFRAPPAFQAAVREAQRSA
jgi:hypothetical protein